MRAKEKAVSHLMQILERHLYADPTVLQQISEQIYWGVVNVAIEDMRIEWSFNMEELKRNADGGDH